jgi:hypothetical protein
MRQPAVFDHRLELLVHFAAPLASLVGMAGGNPLRVGHVRFELLQIVRGGQPLGELLLAEHAQERLANLVNELIALCHQAQRFCLGVGQAPKFQHIVRAGGG